MRAPIPASLQERSNKSAMLVVLNVARQLNTVHFLSSFRDFGALGPIRFQKIIPLLLYPPHTVLEPSCSAPKNAGNVYNDKNVCQKTSIKTKSGDGGDEADPQKKRSGGRNGPVKRPFH